MATRLFPIKFERRRLSELLAFLERVLVGVECGLELGYVWELLEPASPPVPFAERLKSFAQNPPLPTLDSWFRALYELYREGAPLVPFLEAFCDSLRDRLKREVERHERELPTQLNIVLLLFCLPPVFVLLFGPLLGLLLGSE